VVEPCWVRGTDGHGVDDSSGHAVKKLATAVSSLFFFSCFPVVLSPSVREVLLGMCPSWTGGVPEDRSYGAVAKARQAASG